jgi:DNA invertase Pin-like site-specific DNA recombinase
VWDILPNQAPHDIAESAGNRIAALDLAEPNLEPEGGDVTKKAAIYARVSTPDQCVDNQLYQLRELAARRGYEIVHEYTDIGSGSKSRRAGLDALLADANRREFSIVLVAAFDRVARSVKHFLTVVDELNDLGIEFVSARENIDTSGAMGRMFVTIIGCIAELERSLIIERIKAGMRRRRLEGLPLGRAPLAIDREALVGDRRSGMSLTVVAKKYGVSRASVVRFAREAMKGKFTQVTAQPQMTQAPAECVA